MSKRRTSARMRGAFLALSALMVLTVSGCTPNMDSFKTVTDRGAHVRWLMSLSFILSFIMLALVFGILLYSMLRFRKGSPSEREGNTRLEIFWTATPALLLVVLFILSVRTMNAVSKEHSADDDVLTVRVIGNQWWWAFEYPDLGITTANELHIPTDRPIRLELLSNDVVHSFWVPQIGWKLDTIPGRTNIMNFTVKDGGTFDGACAEFCGAQHAWMRIHVVVSPEADFDAWSKNEARPGTEPSSLIARDGRQTFLTQSCAACHTVAGTQAQGKVGPDLTHFGNRATIGAGVLTNTPENLEAWLRDPKQYKPGILMPGFDRLSDEQIQSLVEYLEGLK
ncbi:MAG TPA: cytochrome c oxidase subunit II [Thermomicrobiales bacterium]|nr:cytochrome c oxidase subunit II [Thermomicrobiales bacterium]